eukprot:TRINITY_DN5814_c0_g1_i1.p1 TRINITY_DN5814_c0_g1~~TRINITY_DN5814_c0_g1_i1.p1  ORF type:complete len:422 (-),score=51.72 TRINITY_DN5814_c0_g1_i1:768-2033(-)
MVSSYSRSTSGHLSRSTSGHYSRRSGTLGSPRASILVPRNSWIPRSFSSFVVFCVLASLFSAMVCGYLYFLPNLGSHYGLSEELMGSTDRCDLFNGSWVLDDSYPLYNSSECPFAEQGFNCLANGRTDRYYQNWRWKPLHCDLPPFDVRGVLEWLRGKRVVFVGDSMSRTQWESMICMLMAGVEDKKTVYEVNGNKITKQIRFLGVRFSSFNFTVEFFRSVFLVQQGRPPRHAPKRVQSALKLDLMDDINRRWIDSDVLVFNSGQWWTPGKLFGVGCYFLANSSLKLGMPISTAFRTAMDTWSSWVETVVNTSRTHVFFRTFEPSHWGPDRSFCNVTQYPMYETNGNDYNVFSNIISEVVANMTVPVTLLDVTYMGALRSDAHVGKWSDAPSALDCSHWCLPGVPDAWNELLFSHIRTKLS